jgi:hypothetical protein
MRFAFFDVLLWLAGSSARLFLRRGTARAQLIFRGLLLTWMSLLLLYGMALSDI